MRMIPDYLLHTKSNAEEKVFDKLRAIHNGDGWYAFHSLNLPRHNTKRFGEVDFVVCGPNGLFTFEVKGGRISCQDGTWGTTDAKDIFHQLREAPYTQAEGALHGLINKLDEKLQRKFVCGYGVITPDASMERISSAEWDKQVWADSLAFRDFEKWFNRFVKHWNEINTRPTGWSAEKTNQEDVRTLVKFLRPDFDTATPLYAQVSIAEESIATLTEEQLRFVDIIEANPRVICDGGAGTGKTFLAVEIARRWSANGKRTALVCYSEWLKRYFEKMAIPGVTISGFDSLEVSARRAGVENFDAIVIDEGQDILNLGSLDAIDKMLVGGLENSYWCFFHDINNQAGVIGEYNPEALDYLKEFAPTYTPLRRNCRNTAQILSMIQESLNVDMGINSVGDGPQVIMTQASDEEKKPDLLKKQILDLLKNAVCTSQEIVILSPKQFKNSSAWQLNEDSVIKITELDSYSLGVAREGVGFATISDFKGLESEVVILIDMPGPGSDPILKNLQYIGMSRARALLCIIAD